MIIKRTSLIKGVSEPEGVIILVDVFRAFSTLCRVVSNGAKRVLLAKTIDEALTMKKKCPSWILVGEKQGKKVAGFDFGNSPFRLAEINLKGKTVVLKTSAGTRGAIQALNTSDKVYLASFLNADCTVKCTKKLNPKEVTVVALGDKGENKSIEDELCADYIFGKLCNQSVSFDGIKKRILSSEAIKIYLDQKEVDFPEEDVDYCLRTNVCKFAFKVKRNNKFVEVVQC